MRARLVAKLKATRTKYRAHQTMCSVVAALALATFVFAACDSGGGSGVQSDEKLSRESLADLRKAHPTPKFRRSQLRQNLVEIVTAQANTTQTTTFFFNLGVTDPISTCPSIGFPIPSTAQLTNPDQIVDRAEGDLAIPQVEPTGIYTGDSTGTYVICIDAKGQAYASYWEGFVNAVSGPARWNTQTKQIELIGPSSFDFSEGTP